MVRGVGTWLAGRAALPTSVRAVFGYYGDAGVFDVGSLRLKRRVDAATEAMIADALAPVEAEIAAEFDRDAVEFSYDTKLILPAKLTLGYLYRRVDEPGRIDHAEALTRLAIEALLDGDMRDARNDDEYEDFAVDFPVDASGRAQIAEIAQTTLQERVDARFKDAADGTRDAYDWAVDVSEAHQDQDDHFRDLLEAATAGDEDAIAAIRREYRDAPFQTATDGADDASGAPSDDEATTTAGTATEDRYIDVSPDALTADDRSLPYARTQYDRVGVIYDGMLRMYRAGGFEIDRAFARSIVLAIVGAQIWLDDVDDYRADRREGQLTPVTAEYLLADDEQEAARRVVEVAEAYLDRAKSAATAADSPLTGIATEYIYRSGTPEALPGSPGGRAK